VPPELWPPAAGAVPPLLADVLAQAALDEVFASLWPGFRAALAPFLAAARPDVGHLLAAATDLAVATQAAEDALVQLDALGTAPPPGRCAAWLEKLGAALPGLAAMEDPRPFVARAVAGLALCAAAAGGQPLAARAAGVAAALLRSPHAAVRAAAYERLDAAAAERWGAAEREWLAAATGDAPPPPPPGAAPPVDANGLVDLLSEPPTLEALAVHGLSAPDSRRAAARLLRAVLASAAPARRRALLSWHAWIRCHGLDPAAQPLVADLMDALEAQHGADAAAESAAGLGGRWAAGDDGDGGSMTSGGRTPRVSDASSRAYAPSHGGGGGAGGGWPGAGAPWPALAGLLLGLYSVGPATRAAPRPSRRA